MKRRDFLKSSALTGGAAPCAPLILIPKASSRRASPLIIATDPDACTLQDVAGAPSTYAHRKIGSIRASKVAAMVDSVIKGLMNKPTVGAAWESLFPAGRISGKTKIAIKINQSYGFENGFDWACCRCPWGAKPEITNAIVTGLTQMLGGFPASNITIFDEYVSHEQQATFSGRPTDVDPRRIMAQGFPVAANVPYEVNDPSGARVVLFDRNSSKPTNASFLAGPAKKRFRLLDPLNDADYWINVVIPKDHIFAGTTTAMKNTYGCATNCRDTHPNNDSGTCDYICDYYEKIHALRPCVVQILDALACLYEGGPLYGPVIQQNVIAASIDPLAIEHYCLEMINRARTANRMHAIATTGGFNGDTRLLGGAHPNASHLSSGNLARYPSLGSFSSDNRINVSTMIPDRMPSLENPQSRLMDLVHDAGGWRLGVLMDASGRNHVIESRVVDIEGREVRSFRVSSTRMAQSALEWDTRNDSGATVGPGIYSWQVRVDGLMHHQVLYC